MTTLTTYDRAVHALKAIRKAGVAPSPAVAAAETRAAMRPTLPDLKELQNRVSSAKTQEELDAAARDLAFEISIRDARRSQDYTRPVSSFGEADVVQAVQKEAPALADEIIGRFNDLAPGFQEAIAIVPDNFHRLPATQATPEMLTAARAAEDAYAKLVDLWKAYQSLYRFLGIPYAQPREADGAVALVNQLGRFESGDHAADAVSRVLDWGRSGSHYVGNAPFGFIVKSGGVLELAHPDEAQRRGFDIEVRRPVIQLR